LNENLLCKEWKISESGPTAHQGRYEPKNRGGEGGQELWFEDGRVEKSDEVHRGASPAIFDPVGVRGRGGRKFIDRPSK